MDTDNCRYCHNREAFTANLVKNELLDGINVKTFNKTRRKVGACQSCRDKLELIETLKKNLQMNQLYLHQTMSGSGVTEPEIVVKLERDDDEYKDPLICVEPNGVSTTHDELLYERCDLCNRELLPNELKLHIETAHNVDHVTRDVKVEREMSDEESLSEYHSPNAESFLEAEMKADDEELPEYNKQRELLQRALKDHKLVTDNGEYYECPECRKTFKGEKNLKAHISRALHLPPKKRQRQREVIHVSVKPEPQLYFQCEECKKKFAKRQSLRRHLVDVHRIQLPKVEKQEDDSNERKFICDYCNYAFKTKMVLRTHLLAHIGINKKAKKKYFVCPICKETIRYCNPIEAKRHEALCNGEPKMKEINQCCQCQEIFETEPELRLHFDSVHGFFPEDTSTNKKKKWSCRYCHKKYIFKISIPKHCMDRSYKEDLNPKVLKHQCEECGRTFRTKFQLGQHKIQHVKSKEPDLPKIYACDVPDCTKSYAFLHELKRHKKYHQEKNFKCHLCDFAFFDSGRVQSHNEKYHANNQPLTCSLCFLQFVIFENFKAHLDSHRPEKCEECQSTYKNKDSLRRHIREQHGRGLEEIPCTICHEMIVRKRKRHHICYRKPRKEKREIKKPDDAILVPSFS